MSYLGKIYWSWGNNHRFREVKEVNFNDKSEINEILKKFILTITRKYAYDCNKINKPLETRISRIEIIPIAESEVIYFEDTGLENYLDNEIEWYGKLIKDNKAYIEDGRDYNYEISPKNRE